MSLLFIDEKAVGPSERRLIRSHVMKGKNAGRPRPSTRRQKVTGLGKRYGQQNGHATAFLGIPAHAALPGPDPLSEMASPAVSLGQLRLIWNDMSLIRFPDRMTSEATKGLHRCRARHEQ